MAFLICINMTGYNKFQEIISKIVGDSPATKTALNYLVFVFISFIFWVFISLNNNVQYDMELPIKINSIPDSTTIITECPTHVNVSVKDKGISLLKFILGKTPTLSVNFADYATTDDVFFVSNTELRKNLKNLFENSTILQSVSLENINLKFTNLPGKKVPVRFESDIRPNLQYIIFGNIKQNHDSVLVYSDKNTLVDIDEVYTYRLEERELTDTLISTVLISPIKGVKIVPDKITVTIPVEPLISKKIKIPVYVKNLPAEINVITFPSEVVVSFLVPFSMYRKNQPFNAVVDYTDVLKSNSSRVRVNIEEYPALYNNISLEQDSVEYIIEKSVK